MSASQDDTIEYRIQLTPLALEMLAEIKDRRQRQSLSTRIDKLKSDPEKQGKPLVDKLKNYRSVRALGQRYRIIYKVDRDLVLVLVVGVGCDERAINKIFTRLWSDSWKSNLSVGSDRQIQILIT